MFNWFSDGKSQWWRIFFLLHLTGRGMILVSFFSERIFYVQVVFI